MRGSLLVPPIALALSLGGAAAATQAPGPFRFARLERVFRGDGDMDGARETVRAHVPAGTPRAAALAILEQAGARCDPGAAALRCVYEGKDEEGLWSETDRWTTTARIDQGCVSDLSVDRTWSDDHQT